MVTQKIPSSRLPESRSASLSPLLPLYDSLSFLSLHFRQLFLDLSWQHDDDWGDRSRTSKSNGKLGEFEKGKSEVDSFQLTHLLNSKAQFDVAILDWIGWKTHIEEGPLDFFVRQEKTNYIERSFSSCSAFSSSRLQRSVPLYRRFFALRHAVVSIVPLVVGMWSSETKGGSSNSLLSPAHLSTELWTASNRRSSPRSDHFRQMSTLSKQ